MSCVWEAKNRISHPAAACFRPTRARRDARRRAARQRAPYRCRGIPVRNAAAEIPRTTCRSTPYRSRRRCPSRSRRSRRRFRSPAPRSKGARAGELDGVLQQVHPNLLDESRVAARARQRLQHHLWVAACGRARLFNGLLRHARHVQIGHGKRFAAEAREFEDAFDQLAHLLAVVADNAEKTAALVVQPPRVVLLHHARESVDGAKRRPQIVGYRVAEALELLVRLLQLLPRGLEFPSKPQYFGVERGSTGLKRFRWLGAASGHHCTVSEKAAARRTGETT